MSIISLNGNIGADKSTLVNKLKEKLKYNDKYIFISEPVDVWESIKDEDDKGLIENFYNDKDKFSFCFQMTAYISILAVIKREMAKNPNKTIITERCMNSARNVFAKMLRDDKHMTNIEYTVYNMWHDEFSIKDIKYVYLKTGSDICYERINKRQRKGEDKINLDYLKKLEKYHDEWLNNESNVLCLNGNLDFENDDSIIDEWIKEIDNIQKQQNNCCVCDTRITEKDFFEGFFVCLHCVNKFC